MAALGADRLAYAEKAKKVPGISYVINLAPDLSDGGRELHYDGFGEPFSLNGA